MKTIYLGHPDQNLGHVTYSQNGEDIMVLNLFSMLKIERPSYLDIGAHHPTNISNTKILYDLGSRGVNVEANPNLYSNFLRDRPLDVNVNLAVGPTEAVMDFYMYDDFSGRNTFVKEELNDIIGKHRSRVPVVKKLAVTTLNKIVAKFCKGGKFPDFLSCDIEGLDFSVLEATDFSNSSPMVICVECRMSNSYRMSAMMRCHGFEPYCRMGENIIYIHRDLYPDLMGSLGVVSPLALF